MIENNKDFMLNICVMLDLSVVAERGYWSRQ